MLAIWKKFSTSCKATAETNGDRRIFRSFELKFSKFDHRCYTLDIIYIIQTFYNHILSIILYI